MSNDKQKRYDLAYLKMARTWGELSHCHRKKVGALIVKDRMIISDGYNGTPSGFENSCEEPRYILRFLHVGNVVNSFIRRELKE